MSGGIRTAAAVMVAVAVALGACTGGPPGDTSTPSPSPMGTAVLETPRASNLRYQTTQYTKRMNPLVDVWALPAGQGRPVVVMFHGGTTALDKRYLRPLARLVAARGAVVFVPTVRSEIGRDIDEALEVGRAWRDGAACAVAYAVAHAAEYGGDPSTLVIFGHSSGGTIAETVATRGVHDSSGCAVEPTAFDVDGLVAWEGDPLLAGSRELDENYPDDIPRMMDEVTPWRWLATGKPFNVDLVTGEQSARDLVAPVPDETGDWLARRDPSGVFRQELKALGALDDSAVGVSDETDLLGARMTGLSYNVRHVVLPGAAHMWEDTTTEAQQLLVQSIMTVASR